ncbi:MAG: hypothetical protein COW08_06180 [Ignavibacteriales bacterium CG12_big_fil_rev_8_21_14_0_65_30_8]|nr:MAG: hypothetical protein COW08_06180 [Ignavibacteriales bacterium CG12_big_fil_rev_8_21_14_0_65_30_8]
MPQRKRKDIRKALIKKGFIEENNDHYFYTLVYKNKIQPIYTKISKGSKYKILQDGLLSLMSTQMKLSNKEFLGFVDCNISKDEYVALLQEKKLIPNE